MSKPLVYNVQINYDGSELAASQRRANKATEDTNQSVQEQISLLDRLESEGNSSTQSLRQGFQRLERQLEELPSTYGDVVAAQNRMAASSRTASRSMRTMRGATSGANQAVFSFGDILNDAQQFQYSFAAGSRAIGNNISFLAEQFTNVRNRAGGFRGALSAVKGALMGPAGIVLGISAAVSIITIFGDKLFGASKEAEALEKALDELDNQAEVIISTLNTLNAFEFDRFGIKQLQQQIEATYEREAQLLKEITEQQRTSNALADARMPTVQNMIKGYFGLFDVQQDIAKTQEQIDKTLTRRQKLQEKLQRQKKALNDQDVIAADAAEQLRNEVEATIELMATAGRFEDDPFGLAQARTQLRLLTQGLSELPQEADARQAVVEQIERIRGRINETLRLSREYGIDLTQQSEQQRRNTAAILSNIEAASRINIATISGGVITPEEQAAIDKRLQAQAEEERFQQRIGALAVESNMRKTTEQIALGDDYAAAVKRQQEAVRAEHRLTQEQRINYALHAAEAVGNTLTVLFEDSKLAAIAAAIINAGAAIVRQFKDLPIYAAIPSAALVAAKTAIQISKMKSIKPGSSGNVSAAGGGGAMTGFRTQTVNNTTAQQVNIPQPETPNQQININLHGDISDESISVRAERGRAERERATINVISQ